MPHVGALQGRAFQPSLRVLLRLMKNPLGTNKPQVSAAIGLFILHESLYTVTMDVDIQFCQSAFKHGIREADIRWAIDTVKYDGWLEDDEDTENKRLLIGFDRNAIPIEIYYNILDRDTVRVFHAMKCRSIHKHLLEDE